MTKMMITNTPMTTPIIPLFMSTSPRRQPNPQTQPLNGIVSNFDQA